MAIKKSESILILLGALILLWPNPSHAGLAQRVSWRIRLLQFGLNTASGIELYEDSDLEFDPFMSDPHMVPNRTASPDFPPGTQFLTGYPFLWASQQRTLMQGFSEVIEAVLYGFDGTQQTPSPGFFGDLFRYPTDPLEPVTLIAETTSSFDDFPGGIAVDPTFYISHDSGLSENVVMPVSGSITGRGTITNPFVVDYQFTPSSFAGSQSIRLSFRTVPAPLPLFSVIATLSLSRKLRSKIKKSGHARKQKNQFLGPKNPLK